MEVCYCVVKELELSSEYFGRNCKTLLNQFVLYLPSYSFVLVPYDMVEDTAFYHCGHFWTLQCISKWGNGDFLFG